MRDEPWTVHDLTKRDVELLCSASMLPEKHWFCFGRVFFKLLDLGLVDENTFVTNYGREMANAYARNSQ